MPQVSSMPTAMEEIALAFELSFATQQASSITKDVIKAVLDETASSLVTKFEGYALQRKVLFDTDPGQLDEKHVVLSPITHALERCYVGDEQNPLALATGRSYVIFAPSNQGKTHSARDFLENYLPILDGENGERIPAAHGIMITGTPGPNYSSYMSQCLGTQGCTNWIFSLIAALCPDPKVPKRPPSILILDSFDVQNEINEFFIRKLFMATKGKGFYTIILTQNEAWASHMASMNHGGKILAHPSAMEGGTATIPIWNRLVWSRELLTRMIAKRYPEKSTDWTDENGLVRWIEMGWTPEDCLYHAETLLNAPKSPERARKR